MPITKRFQSITPILGLAFLASCQSGTPLPAPTPPAAAAAPAYPEIVFARPTPRGASKTPMLSTAAVPSPAASPTTLPCSSSQTLVFSSNVPGQARLIDQNDADCYAWQELISLNWPVDSTEGFGAPGDPSPVQWQTFMSDDLLFPDSGAPPPAWGTQPPLPPSCASETTLPQLKKAGAIRSLQMSTKVSGAFVPTDVGEAFPFNGPAWLGAQNGTNVWFEVVVNQDEYTYVVNNKLYNAQSQATFVNNGAGSPVFLPVGTSSSVGAIEIKAAWMEITDPENPKWAQRYKVAVSTVMDPVANRCRNIAVALVAMHILHKTSDQSTWLWATFEHVDNAPNQANVNDPAVKARTQGAPNGGYNFYNPNCQSQNLQVPSSCVPNGGTGTSALSVGCGPNTPPPYNLGPGCSPVPIQVTREIPIDPSTMGINTKVQQALQSLYPGTVWQYYQLVNMIWSTQAPPPPTKPQKPDQVYLQSMQPQGVYPPFGNPTTFVANTVLETYKQKSTCLECHKGATLANGSPWFADFSFLLGNTGPRATSTSAPRALK